MLESKSYKLLTTLYKKDAISLDDVVKFTGVSVGYHNPYMEYLISDGLADIANKGKEPTLKITLKGRAHVEAQRRNTAGFWIPYTITTIIAVASMVLSLVGLIIQSKTP